MKKKLRAGKFIHHSFRVIDLELAFYEHFYLFIYMLNYLYENNFIYMLSLNFFQMTNTTNFKQEGNDFVIHWLIALSKDNFHR